MARVQSGLIDHIDLRVRDLDAAAAFYDVLMSELGLRERGRGEDWITYGYPGEDGRVAPFFGLTQSAAHAINETRIAFAGASRADVDRLAGCLRRIGARSIEGPMLCPEYTPVYYAVFFADPDGNKLEICHRTQPAASA
jgi:catechol 2,3-dioxygenase-like lactoylglutathione lyase family enzyme